MLVYRATPRAPGTGFHQPSPQGGTRWRVALERPVEHKHQDPDSLPPGQVELGSYVLSGQLGSPRGPTGLVMPLSLEVVESGAQRSEVTW